MGQDPYLKIYRKTMEDFICFIAHWELTYRCNLKCRHCYICQDKTGVEFSFKKAKSIIDELKSMGCLYLILSGGEIFMREDFFDIASYARRQDFALRLMTNGTLINESVGKDIASLHPLTVEMSIYAANKDLHDAITSVAGSFDKTIKAIELLRRIGIKVVVKFLIMKDNVGEFSAVKSLAEEIGADFVFDYCVVSKNDNSSSPLEYRLDRRGIKDFLIANHIVLNEKEAGDYTLLCSAGLNNIFITPYLDVYPCIGLNLKAGNLRKQTLREIWASRGLSFVRNIKFSELYKCKNCSSRQFCYRCAGIALVEDGDIFGPSNFDCSAAEVIKEIIKEREEGINYG